MIRKAKNFLKNHAFINGKFQGLILKNDGFEIYQYCKSDGSFDYDKYRNVQIKANKKKIDKVAVLEENIAFLSDYVKGKLGDVQFGICHGTRRGKEQKWFGKYLDCEVIGTEISDTAKDFPNTIQWDFHDVKSEWIDSVDFIYSNSLDHSYNPEKCLDVWMSCLKNKGMCIIEHSSDSEAARQMDPFGAPITLMPYLILVWGKGVYSAREIIDAPAITNARRYIKFFIIQKN